MKNYLEEYNLWLNKATKDPDLILELKSIANDEAAIKDAFYKDLEFGTGGLRGVIGAGSNKLNVYTIGKASQGLANYILKNIKKEDRKVAVSYDSRIKSDVFAKITASVLAANGIKVFIYKTLMPVPCLSFATRELKCAFGVMVTASHNPSQYNGYKVYGPDGCQVISDVADGILNEMNALDIFNSVKLVDFDKALNEGMIEYTSNDVYEAFIKQIRSRSMLYGEKIDTNCKIVYSPLHGTGLIPVTDVLKRSGFNDVVVVKEQELPDGHFTTCPYPNPEIREAMALGIEYCQKLNADLLLATDPDCDRVGIAVKNDKGEFTLLTGNETGILLLNYILEQRKAHNDLHPGLLAVKTIVSTDLANSICEKYNIKLANVLTGFKYIGEQIAILEKENRASDFLFGFEESYGYLSGTHVRDKDGVNAAFLICEMFAFYRSKGISLYNKLQSLYQEYGYFNNYLKSFEFKGADGFVKMTNIMNDLRNNLSSIGEYKVNDFKDYSLGIDGLPKSNVLKFYIDIGTVIARPSGTEPKLKIYLSLKSDSKENNDKNANYLFEEIAKLF